MYPYFRAWSQVRRRLDPLLIFSNSYMDRIFASDQLNTSKASLFARKSFDNLTTTTTTTEDIMNSSWSSIGSETIDVKLPEQTDSSLPSTGSESADSTVSDLNNGSTSKTNEKIE